MYNIVHTGPNNQFGGLNEGLTNPEYQVVIEGVVKIDPINPITKQITTDIISLPQLLTFIFIIMINHYNNLTDLINPQSLLINSLF
jgi:hypothetical protein